MPRSEAPAGLRVGISVLCSPGANVWNNGLNQNLAFLVQLLLASPRVAGVYLLRSAAGDILPAGMEPAVQGAQLVPFGDMTHTVDVVIEMGVQLPVEWMSRVRARGARTILFVVGHTYAGLVENPIFGRGRGMSFANAVWDEVWTLPHHMHASGPVLRTLTRAPVKEMPYLWSPFFLQEEGTAFGFPAARRAVGAGWRVGIFEPNISVVKNCTVPLLACEQAYRADRGCIERVMVMNTFHMKEHPTFNSLAAHLNLTRDSKATFEKRVGFAECMSRFGLDMVVTHQWECGLNNLYFDTLFGSYPLVHNSEYLRREGVGLFYPAFDALAAADVIAKARCAAPDFWKGYEAAGKAFIERVAPLHPRNVAAYEERLVA
jgi:hypothetical protein